MKWLLLLIWLLLPTFGQAQVNLDEWEAQTPGGHEINNYSTKSLVLMNGRKLSLLKRWYFYKDYIVGERFGSMGYFIVNERTAAVDTFATQQAWQQEIRARQLTPVFWTRWYESSWELFGRPEFFYFGLVAIPIFLLLMFIIFLFALFREKFRRRRPFTKILIAMHLIILFIYLYDNYPQSF